MSNTLGSNVSGKGGAKCEGENKYSRYDGVRRTISEFRATTEVACRSEVQGGTATSLREISSSGVLFVVCGLRTP